MTNILKESIYKKKKKKRNKTCCKGKKKTKRKYGSRALYLCFIENFLVVDKNCHDHKRKVILLFQLSLVWLWLFCYPLCLPCLLEKSLWNSGTPRQQMIGNNYDQGKIVLLAKREQSEGTLFGTLYKIFSLQVWMFFVQPNFHYSYYEKSKKLFNRSVCVVYHWISIMLYPKDIAKKYRKWVNEWVIMLPWTWL